MQRNKITFLTVLSVTCVFLSLGACSSRYYYDAIQHNQRAQCKNVPPSEYDDCVKRHSESYGKYQQKREEATQPE